MRTPGGPPLWVIVHFMVKWTQSLYQLLSEGVAEVYTLTQMEPDVTDARCNNPLPSPGRNGCTPPLAPSCLCGCVVCVSMFVTVYVFVPILGVTSCPPPTWRYGPRNPML